MLTVVATGLLYATIHKGFLPQQDTGLLIGTTDAAQDISFAAMSERQQQVAALISRDPDVVTVDSFVGAGTVNTTLNSGRLYIDIGAPDGARPRRPRSWSGCRRATAGVHGITLHLQPAQDLQIETRVTRTQYQYVLQDLDEDELRHLEHPAGRSACASSRNWPTSPTIGRMPGCRCRSRSTGRPPPATASP